MKAIFGAILLIACSSAYAAQSLTISEWLDIFVDSCVGSGTATITSGDIGANGDISLKKMSLSGAVSGNVAIARNSYRLLSEGISNKMTTVAANQADKVRECLEPLRRNLLQLMNRQMGLPAGGAGAKPVYLLSPDEEKVMKVLAVTQGNSGTGQQVPFDKLVAVSGMSDIRLRATLKMLQQKLLAAELANLVFLWDAGNEYVLEMGYAK